MTRKFFTRKTSEQTTKKNQRPRQKEEVYMVVTDYGAGKESKVGDGDFFGVGDEDH